MERTVSETLAAALAGAGVKVVTYVPGFGGNEVFADFNRISPRPWPMSFHEEAAFSISHGAAMVGVRSASLLKSHGLVKAGNSVTDALYSGTTAGFLSIIFNDNNGMQSDSIIDIWSFLRGIGIPYQNADLDRIPQQTAELFALSEKRSLPYALVVESTDVPRLVPADPCTPEPFNAPVYQRDIVQRVLCPFFLDYQHQVLRSKERFEDWRGIPRPAVPRIPDSLPEKWKPAAGLYAPLFSAFQSVRGTLVTGDTGVSTLFACEPFNCIDITTYMGGSIPLAIGAYLGGCRDVWALTGDFSFIAAGHLGLLEAWQRQIPLKVLIFCNGKAETTGGQPLPDGALEKVLAGYSSQVLRLKNPGDPAAAREVLEQAGRSPKMQIVAADYRKLL
jgi:TPP-dependent indolepyruvate ferredoxin oxidoreductase alpha subunit